MRKMMFVVCALAMMSLPAFAQGAGGAAAGSTNWVALTSGFAIAIAAAVAAIGQSRVAGAACEGMARNPGARAGIQLALILGLAFIESLVLFTLVIIFVKVA